MADEGTRAEIDTPAALYVGEVMHARLRPIGRHSGHRFCYRVMSLLIDLDRLDEADRQSPLFGVNRFCRQRVREVPPAGSDLYRNRGTYRSATSSYMAMTTAG